MDGNTIRIPGPEIGKLGQLILELEGSGLAYNVKYHCGEWTITITGH